MPFPRERFLASLSKFLTPFVESTIRYPKISRYLRFTLSAALKKLNRLLLEFLRIRWLRFAH